MLHVPKVGFKWEFTIGNLLSAAVMIIGAFAAWYQLSQQTDEALKAVARLPQLEARMTANETSIALLNQTIEVGRTARLTFQASVVETFKSIEADRREQGDVNAEMLAQLRVIVSRLDDQRDAARTSEYRGPLIPGDDVALARALTLL